MGPRRLGIALIAALVISLGITSVFYARIARTQARQKTRRIIAAAVALQPGSPIAAESLTEIDWPLNVPLEGLIEKKDDITGHTLMSAVAVQQPVLRRDLASSASLGLSAKSADGMRASAGKTNEVTNIAGFVFPSSRVDVLVTLKPDNNAASMETRTVLQNVLVLSTGTKIDPDPNGKPENVTVVTLLVTPEQSEKLALSQTHGTFHFLLPTAADPATPQLRPVDFAELAGIEKKPVEPVVKHASQVSPVAKVPSVYSVETVINGKSTTAQFPVNQE